MKGSDVVSGIFAIIGSLTESVQKAMSDAHAQGYQEGYEAAVRNIMDAATAARPITEPATAPNEPPRMMRRRDSLPAPAQRAPWGLVPKAINRVLDGAGDHGIDIPMVQASAHNHFGHLVAESSVRSTLIDMTNRGELERRDNGRWYRVNQDGDGGNDTQAPPAASYPHNQGGSDETALAAE